MEQVGTDSRCMWCGASKVEIHHQYVLPICDGCLNEFREN